MGREPAIDDERAPKRLPDTREVRREPGPVIAAMVRDAREACGPYLTTRVSTVASKGALETPLLTIGSPVVRPWPAVGPRPAPHAPFRPGLGARPRGLVLERVPGAIPRVPRRTVIVPPPSEAGVPPYRQARLRAVMEVAKITDVLSGETVLAPAPSSEEAPGGT